MQEKTQYGKGFREALSGRAIAIALVVTVSGASFALGFFVGKAARDTVAGTEPHAPLAETAAPPRTIEEEAISELKQEAPGDIAAYTVQAGSFRDRAKAEAMKRDLQEQGYSAYVLRSPETDDGTFYRVRVGAFRDKSEAEVLALKIKELSGQDAFVTSD